MRALQAILASCGTATHLTATVLLGISAWAGSPTAAAEQYLLVRPHAGVELETAAEAKQITGLTPQQTFSENGLTWNIFYDDVNQNTGIGFDGPNGTEAQARVEDAARYIARVLNENGTLDVRFEVSETDASNFLAAAGSRYFVADGFEDPISLIRLRDGLKPAANVAEIDATVDFGYPWNFSDGPPGGTEFDFVSVIVHELTHGLGFASLTLPTGQSQFSNSTPPANTFATFDQFLRRGSSGVPLWGGSPVAFQGNSADLVSDDVEWSGPAGNAAFAPADAPPIFAPNPYNQGSSISHWDSAIPGGAVMVPTIAPGFQLREYTAVEIGALVDLGYVNAAEPQGEEPPQDCGPLVPCPDFQAGGQGLYTGLGEDWATADLDGTGITDRFEMTLYTRVLCQQVSALNVTANCAYVINAEALAAEPALPALTQTEEAALIGLLSISSELQAEFVARLGLTGDYVTVSPEARAKAAGELLAATGDPDSDSLSNLAEFQNTTNAGLSAEDYATAALNPLLDGTATADALPLGQLALGGLLAALGAAGLVTTRRRR